VRTPPSDLAETVLRGALADGWALAGGALAYRPVGFGSHHWELNGTDGGRWFVTVDDLRARRMRAREPLTAGYERLRAALAAALALRGAGCDFVVAPVPGAGGEPVRMIGDCFAAAVYPFVTGESVEPGDVTREILELIVAVHTAPPSVRDRALVDGYAVQLRDILTGNGGGSDLGPYASRAAELTAARATDVRHALARYDDLVAGVEAEPPDLVLTHGEPHPGNTMRADGRWLLVDWDTALLAPPERDLWQLDLDDAARTAYTSATGTTPRQDLLDLYELRWHLAEIAGCLARFRQPHGDTADDAETWTNLTESLDVI
jgi:aminoglycoside phosphotransferase (APT) family kinase protein